MSSCALKATTLLLLTVGSKPKRLNSPAVLAMVVGFLPLPRIMLWVSTKSLSETWLTANETCRVVYRRNPSEEVEPPPDSAMVVSLTFVSFFLACVGAIDALDDGPAALGWAGCSEARCPRGC